MATVYIPQNSWTRISGQSVEPALSVQFATVKTLYIIQSATQPTFNTLPTISIASTFKQFFKIVLNGNTPLYGYCPDIGGLTIYTGTLTTFQNYNILYYY